MNRQFGIQFNNRVWELPDTKDRDSELDEEMIHATGAWYLHRCEAGTELSCQPGTWMLSHVYSELGVGERATHYTELCSAITIESRGVVKDFDVCYADKAQAHAIIGNHRQAQYFYERASSTGEPITESGDRCIFIGDLTSGNWANFRPNA